MPQAQQGHFALADTGYRTSNPLTAGCSQQACHWAHQLRRGAGGSLYPIEPIYKQECIPADFSHSWALFTMFHAHASVIFHATSSWLTVSLAQIRVLTIRRATLGPTQQVTERSTVLLAIATCILMALVNLPNFLTFEVMEVPARMFLSCMGAGEEPSEGALAAEGNASAVYSSSSSSGGVGEESVYVVRAEENDCMKLRVSAWAKGALYGLYGFSP